MNKKILIIKTGFSEVFTESKSVEICSLGDVLRTTFILHYFSNDKVDWLTSVNAEPLLKNNNYIENLFVESSQVIISSYDLVINLEKNIDFNIMDNFRVVGFISQKNEIYVKTSCETIYSFKDYLMKINHEKRTFQEKLAGLIGKEWKNENYILENAKEKIPKYDIGLNWKCGDKWPEKLLPESVWIEIENLFPSHFSISRQQGFDDLVKYIDWIDSCNHIITIDTLGLHIGIALKKKVTAIFGPTNPFNVEMYNMGTKIHIKNKNYENLINQIKAILPTL